MSVFTVLITANKLINMLNDLASCKFCSGNEKCILKVYTVLLVVVLIGKLYKTEYGKITGSSTGISDFS
jgi:hypothetical protein